MKKIRLPVKLTVGIDLVDGEPKLVRFDVKYRASVPEYPEFPETSLVFTPVLTSAQESTILRFCKDVILPQLEVMGEIYSEVNDGLNPVSG